jgi:peptidyl-prolyl cis-trans isomerase B (cyclophilin B)
MIIIQTNIGNIKIITNQEKAPISSENFINYVKDGYYDNLIFHRVIKNFMIQAGGFTEDMAQKPTKSTIENEANNGLKNTKYSLAMARTSEPHSASSQFFINTADNSFLDYPGQDGYGYCVFGEVTEGFEVVDKINNIATTTKGYHNDVPEQAIIIQKAYMED